MKKLICLCTVLLVLFSSTTAFAAEEMTYYEEIVPTAYGEIVFVTDMYFIERVSPHLNEVRYNLYTLSGETVLSDCEDIRIVEGYIVVSETGTYEVLTNTLEQAVPAKYSSISIISTNRCVAMQNGSLYLLELPSGQVVEHLGEGEMPNDIRPNFMIDNKADQLMYGQKIVADDGDTSFETYYALTKPSNQMVLDFRPYSSHDYNSIQFDSSGHYIYGFASFYQPIHYLFSGRGRLIKQSDSGYYNGFMNGLYIEEMATDMSSVTLLNNNGDIVIPGGIYNDYRYNFSHTYNGHVVDQHISTDHFLCVVKQSDKYGVIRLNAYMPQASNWAKAEVDRANALGFVPEVLNLRLKDQCTREEFCQILANSFEKITDESLESIAKQRDVVTFDDTTDPYVLAAAALGIVNGIGDSKFAPDRYITREEAAVMLARASERLSIEVNSEPLMFKDQLLVSSWAADSINRVTSISVNDNDTRLMQGTWNNHFDPKAYYTIEQSIITFLRLVEADVIEY